MVAEETDPVGGVVYRAESFIAVGQVDRAETLVRGELGRHPDDASLLLTLAKVFETRGQWPEVVSTATAALEANPNSLNARMTLAIAGYRLDDRELMKRNLDEVLAHRPDQPTALMYLAFHESDDRSAAGKKRTRMLYRRALEHGGGDPWYIAAAARMERRFGSISEARKLVDAGLEQNPTDAALLQLKTEFSTTTTDESMGILGGLLASSPTDPALRARFDAIISTRRLGLLLMLWLAPVLTALVVAFTAGPFRIGGLIAVAAMSFTVWRARNSSIRALPPFYRDELASHAPWRVATRLGGYASATATFLGGALLAVEIAAGAWLLALSVVGWIVARFAALEHERKRALDADAELAVLRPGTAGPGPGPTSHNLGQERWRYVIITPIGVIPFLVVGLIPPGTADVSGAARAVVGIIAAVVGVASLVGAVPWVGGYGSALATWRGIRLVVPGVLLGLALLGCLLNLSTATTGWPADRPGERTESPSTPPTIPPGYFDDLRSPSPMPTIDLPDIEIPDFDIPTIPPLDPEG